MVRALRSDIDSCFLLQLSQIFEFLFLTIFRSQILSFKLCYLGNLLSKKMKKVILTLLLTLLIGLYSSINTQDFKSFAFGENNLQRDPPKTVPHVDLQRYMGLWYEIATIPAWFEKGCEKTFQNFSMNTDGTIKIDNGCSNQKGVQHDGYGKAFPDPKDSSHSNAKLKVKMPPFPGEGDYWIVRLDESYSYAVVSSPDYHHLWVFYRSPIMSEQLYQTIYEDLKKDGFHVEKLKKTIQ